MADLRKLTQQYVDAFNARDIKGVADLLSSDFSLTDPSVTCLGPRDKVIEYIDELFRQNPSLRFVAKRILVDGNSSAIHFMLSLGADIYDGIDLIDWDHDKMRNMNAYLALQSQADQLEP